LNHLKKSEVGIQEINNKSAVEILPKTDILEVGTLLETDGTLAAGFNRIDLFNSSQLIKQSPSDLPRLAAR
jgi:hypothetical protein